MRIDCPHCGPRDSGEFTYLGDASLSRPDGLEAAAEDMAEYVYLRDNPAGAVREYWHHGFGCRAWLVVERNTLTHAISAVEPARRAEARA